ncbi:MAG TPA: DUF4150 domain-containing protein [Candidatus Desulfovibrio intestinipullorum]|uniref:DUF4150 domain-containing protein n=1 Tax=Candidatus Desulfovibrio intestinipullorum TaxID=2838536 RepID=A0A9D1PX15_9BACT|nr:DUF4150 domain-containing protein [Candidatus Desulfovibrio intestinipullorum]
MFALTVGSGQTMGMPDTCLTPTPAGPVPTPYPNIATSAMCPSAAATILMGGTPTINQMASLAMSSGDEAGTATGVVSHLIKGANMWIAGSTAVIVHGSPVMRLTSTGGCNALGMTPNGTSTCIAPSQTFVTVLR